MGNIKKYAFKRIGERLKKLEAEPEELYGFLEDSVWYPNELFLDQIHEMVIREYGGYTGYETGIHLYKVILAGVRKVEGTYEKAATLLRKFITSPRIFQDGNHRTAQIVVETFLQKNGKQMWTDNSQEIYMFIKHAIEYDIEEIAEWLEHGPEE